jgi:hypothetical protein
MIRTILVAAARIACAAMPVLAFAPDAIAQSAYWHGVRSDNWNDGVNGGVSNWYSEPPAAGDPRDVPTAQAIFAPGAVRKTVTVNTRTAVEAMIFQAGVEQYLFNIRHMMSIGGSGGIRNDAALTPRFDVAGLGAFLKFVSGARLIGNDGRAAQILNRNAGSTIFEDNSKAGDASIEGRATGTTTFRDRASADRAFISIGNNARTEFEDRSTGGRATFLNQAGGVLDFSATKGPANNKRLTAGEIDNSGDLAIGLNLITGLDDLVLHQNGTLMIDLRGKKSGVLVTAAARIDGAFVVDCTQPPSKERFVIVKSQARRGRFASLDLRGDCANLDAEIRYFGGDVLLVFPRQPTRGR